MERICSKPLALYFFKSKNKPEQAKQLPRQWHSAKEEQKYPNAYELDIESEVQNVPILHHIFFSLDS